MESATVAGYKASNLSSRHGWKADDGAILYIFRYGISIDMHHYYGSVPYYCPHSLGTRWYSNLSKDLVLYQSVQREGTAQRSEYKAYLPDNHAATTPFSGGKSEAIYDCEVTTPHYE